MDLVLQKLLYNPDLKSRQQVFQNPCPIPKAPGIYAWYFKEFPPGVPTEGCHRYEDYTLLYVGISPIAPPTNGAKPSKQTIWNRLRYHYSGNAEGSTLRLTLGCLLASKLGIQLRRVGSGNRLTFGPGEQKLSNWMDQNAFIGWCEHSAPWKPEKELIRTVNLPLNLDQNQHNSFYTNLKAIRQQAKATARSLPTI